MKFPFVAVGGGFRPNAGRKRTVVKKQEQAKHAHAESTRRNRLRNQYTKFREDLSQNAKGRSFSEIEQRIALMSVYGLLLDHLEAAKYKRHRNPSCPNCKSEVEVPKGEEFTKEEAIKKVHFQETRHNFESILSLERIIYWQNCSVCRPHFCWIVVKKGWRN